jgi:hypothetical protein
MFCPHCGKEITEDQSFCQYCGFRLVTGPGTTSSVIGRSKTPWENREEVGFFPGLFKTLKETLLTPSEFFRKMPVSAGFTDPLLYALIIGMVGLIAHYFWDILLFNSLPDFIATEVKSAAGRSVAEGLRSPIAATIMPFLFIFWLFVASGALHLFLLLARGALAGFEATFRVLAYGVSPFVFLIIPFCGMPITGLWVMTITVIGLKEAHGTTGGKAAFAVFFPFLFCCGLFIAAMVLFMGALAVSFGSMMHFHP